MAAGDLTSTPVPTITGTPKVGVLLTAVPGTWDAGVTFTYQWTVDGTDVGGATGPTYTPVAGDSGKVVTVKVTGTQDRLQQRHQGVRSDQRGRRRRPGRHADPDDHRHARRWACR